jgi:rfaE bifunctional protein nucleotidyltransferase chain/domain
LKRKSNLTNPSVQSHQKILSQEAFHNLIASLKSRGKRIAHCHGAFDLVHPGHIHYLQTAKEQADILVVTVIADAYVDKGPGRPVYNQRLRAEMLAALEAVDYVTIVESNSAAEAIRSIQPNVYVKGIKDQSDDAAIPFELDIDEQAAIESVGARIHLVEDTLFSSTSLLNAYFSVYPPETDAYLRSFRSQYSPDEVIAYLESLRGLKVLVVGDAIIDEYHFCRPYGMASKSTGLAAQFIESEKYAGGSLAVANHIAGFCDTVDLVTVLGNQESHEEFIRGHLKPNIRPTFFFRDDSPTVIKRRYVRPFLTLKLFEISFFNDRPLPEEVDNQLIDYLHSVLTDYDLVLVCDFGHGMLYGKSVDLLSREARFMALNVQLNSANYGFNVVAKYPHADYVCIDEEETRMATRARYGPLENLFEQIMDKLDCQTMTVTRGHNGSTTCRQGEGYTSSPVLSQGVVDPIGAGDAYLAITSLCACECYPLDIIGFIGNAVGALAVRIVGNKSSVEPAELYRFIRGVMK